MFSISRQRRRVNGQSLITSSAQPTHTSASSALLSADWLYALPCDGSASQFWD